MGITAFVPARGGSKGIKEKNIIAFCGKPLIFWVLNALNNAANIDKVVVATDSDKIEETVKSFGFSKIEVYRREDKNAADNSPTIDVVMEYLDFSKLCDDESFLLVQATSPLLTAFDVNDFIKSFNAASDKTSSFSCVELRRICWDIDGKPINHDLKNRKQRQKIDKILIENGAMYINSVENIKREKALLSGNVLPYIMPDDTMCEIDELEDIQVVEQLMKKRFKPSLKDFDLFITDCDGVLTDAGMYYSEQGEVLKKFNTIDGFAVGILKKEGLKVAIVTGESTKFAKARAEKLGIDCYLGIKDKLSCVKEIAAKCNTDLSKVIYVGDDLNDLEVIKQAGFSACPFNAQFEIKSSSNYITSCSGGEGVIREVVNFLL